MSPREHIEHVARSMGVAVSYDQPDYGESQYDPWGRELMLAPWGSAEEEVLYGIALHELGHAAVSPPWPPLDLAWVAHEEAAASLWAFDNRRTDLGLDDGIVVGTLAHSLGNRAEIYGVAEITLEIRGLLERIGPTYNWEPFAAFADNAPEAARAWQRLYDEAGLAVAA